MRARPLINPYFMTPLVLALTPQYGYVLLAAVAISLELLVIGFVFPGAARSKIFSKAFLEEHFGKDAPQGGYPDMGSGRFSEKLSY